ncbi:MAG: DNA/RNA nuclease SfsA [Alphaproteobacteria bacterium]|nr:DNA/RNA nuclease SfsA [Alphaproteobacteria bacterium]
MRFHAPLVRGTLVERYKRFMADVVLETGETVTAHCANSGTMLGLKAPGSTVWLSPAANPDRKLKFTWELVDADGGLVGINTSYPNAIVAEAIAAGGIPELADYGGLRREVKYGRNSRIDILLEQDGRPPCYVEVKNVHLRRDGSLAEFPDAVTARGAKHLVELGDMVAAGHRAVMLYLVQRMDCDKFAIARDVDPAYDAGLKVAVERGVEVLCYGCRLTTEEIAVDRTLQVTI